MELWAGDSSKCPLLHSKFGYHPNNTNIALLQIWRIWPAVLLHICVAAVVVLVSFKTKYNLAIPNVLVTVTGEFYC